MMRPTQIVRETNQISRKSINQHINLRNYHISHQSSTCRSTSQTFPRSNHHSLILARNAHSWVNNMQKVAPGWSAIGGQGGGILARVSTRKYSGHLSDKLNDYAIMPQRGVTLRQMLALGQNPNSEQLLGSAQFLHAELPIRLAKRVKELDNLPYGLSQMPAVRTVRGWYLASFEDLVTCPVPQTADDDKAFTAMLQKIYNRHSAVVPHMALGVLQMKKHLAEKGMDVESIISECPFLYEFLNKFYGSRMAIRVLISQHVALHHPKPGWIGTVALNLSPISVIETAVADARRIAERELGDCPDVIVEGSREVTFSHLPSHLHHCVFELVKNSMRAVVEKHRTLDGPYELPPVRITMTYDDKEFAIRISDQGGGISRENMTRIWSYLFTSNPEASTNTLISQLTTTSMTEAPLSGLGYGLSIARLYARFFGGDLQLQTLPGYGCDAFLYVNRSGTVDIFLD